MGLVPEGIVRLAIRVLLSRLNNKKQGLLGQREGVQSFINELRASPLKDRAEVVDILTRQLPASFYALFLGPNMRFAPSIWFYGDRSIPGSSLALAEKETIDLCLQRSEIADGMEVLDYGCGWGAVSLAIAERFPKSRVTAVSYSQEHLSYLAGKTAEKNLQNLLIVHSDEGKYLKDRNHEGGGFDRILSLESLLHQFNLEVFIERFASWLKPGGKAFVQLLCHGEMVQKFNADQNRDWFARYFLNSGLVPADSLLTYYQRHLLLEHHWRFSGFNHAVTSRNWLRNFDRNKKEIFRILLDTYGADACSLFYSWRNFFITVEEMCAFQEGERWFGSQYLFVKRERGRV